MLILGDDDDDVMVMENTDEMRLDGDDDPEGDVEGLCSVVVRQLKVLKG